MARAGWGVEVISWDGACKRAFKEWARTVGCYIPLENYYDSVTFIAGDRNSKPVSLTRRPRSVPRAA